MSISFPPRPPAGTAATHSDSPMSTIASSSPSAKGRADASAASGLRARLDGQRGWTVFAALTARGAGFLLGVLITRCAGPQALGEYSAIQNTAAAFAAPLQTVLGNNVVLGRGGPGQGGAAWQSTVSNSLLALMLIAAIQLFTTHSQLLQGLVRADPAAAHAALVEAAFLASLASQLLGAILFAGAVGLGLATPVAAAGSLLNLLVAAAAVLIIPVFPGDGPLLFLVGSCTAVLLLPAVILAAAGRRRRDGNGLAAGLRRATAMFLGAWPSFATTVLAVFTFWYCTVYLVGSELGVAAVGVYAVGLQWGTLILLPVTSWGLLTLQALTDAVQCRHGERQALAGQMRKNLPVTALLAGAVAAASSLIPELYSLDTHDLNQLLLINAAAALAAAANNVWERYFLARNQRSRWLSYSAIGCGVQLLFTVTWIEQGLPIVALGALLSALCVLLLAALDSRRRLRRAEVR